MTESYKVGPQPTKKSLIIFAICTLAFIAVFVLIEIGTDRTRLPLDEFKTCALIDAVFAAPSAGAHGIESGFQPAIRFRIGERYCIYNVDLRTWNKVNKGEWYEIRGKWSLSECIIEEISNRCEGTEL